MTTEPKNGRKRKLLDPNEIEKKKRMLEQEEVKLLLIFFFKYMNIFQF